MVSGKVTFRITGPSNAPATHRENVLGLMFPLTKARFAAFLLADYASTPSGWMQSWLRGASLSGVLAACRT